MEAKTKENISKAKDLAAQQHGYADWQQLDMLEESQDHVIELKYNMIDEVAVHFADQQTAELRAENERLREALEQIVIKTREPQYGLQLGSILKIAITALNNKEQ